MSGWVSGNEGVIFGFEDGWVLGDGLRVYLYFCELELGSIGSNNFI